VEGKQETDQTVLTTTKALTKTTNCTCRAEKVEGTIKKISGDVCSPYFEIRLGDTGGRDSPVMRSTN